MNKQQYATLLGQKIFNDGNQDEINAFLNLDLDVDWLAVDKKGNPLILTAFKTIKDEELFVQWWDRVRAIPAFSVWNVLPNGETIIDLLATSSGALSFKTDVLKTYPGTPEQWDEYIQSPQTFLNVLSPSWESVLEQLKNSQSFPKSVLDQMIDLHEENKVLLVKNETELKALLASDYTPKQSLYLFCRAASGLATKDQKWQLKSLMGLKSFQAWSPEHWKTAAQSVKGGFFESYCYTNAKSLQPYKAMEISKTYLDLVELGKKLPMESNINVKEIALNMITNIAAKDSQDYYKKAHRPLSGLLNNWYERAKTTQPMDFQWGVFRTLLDLQFHRSTQFSEEGLSILKASELPKSYAQLRQELDRINLKINTASMSSMNSGLLAHVVAGHTDESRPVFVSSFIDYCNQLPAETKEQRATDIIAWAHRGVLKASSEKEKKRLVRFVLVYSSQRSCGQSIVLGEENRRQFLPARVILE